MTFLRYVLVYKPNADLPIDSGEELVFVAAADVEDELERLLAPAAHGG